MGGRLHSMINSPAPVDKGPKVNTAPTTTSARPISSKIFMLGILPASSTGSMAIGIKAGNLGARERPNRR